MKISILGATGGIGSQVLKMALDAGHEVVAIGRRPELINVKHHALRIAKGDVLNEKTFAGALKGVDVVVSAIGVRNTKPTTLYSEGIKNITSAMKDAGVERLLCISALPVDGVTPGMPLIMKVVTRFILIPLLKNNYADTLRMEKAVESSGLKWTIIRPPKLTNKEPAGRYRVSVGGHLRSPWSISRADVADFIVRHLDDASTFMKRVEIAA